MSPEYGATIEFFPVDHITLQYLKLTGRSDDTANLDSVGGLPPLPKYLNNSNANIRAKAAEVITRTKQNNPRSLKLIMEASGLEPLLANFTSDPDVTVCTKALGANIMSQGNMIIFPREWNS